MAFLKLTTLDNTPFIANMDKVEEFRSDGAGHTELVYGTNDMTKAKECFEDIEQMLHISLIGFKGIVSKADILTVVR